MQQTTPIANHRIEYFDLLKGIAIFLVVMGHVLTMCIRKNDAAFLFKLIAETGNIPERDMFNTFNMGVGMSVVVPAEQVQTALDILNGHGETAYVIGEIVENEEKVILA